jgi:hypothetical protein
VSELNLTVGDEPFECRPENTRLYTFLGDLGLYNHVFLTTGRNEEGSATGAYVFETGQDKLYQKLKKHIEAERFPQVINMPGIVQADVTAWETRHLPNYVPEEWT